MTKALLVLAFAAFIFSAIVGVSDATKARKAKIEKAETPEICLDSAISDLRDNSADALTAARSASQAAFELKTTVCAAQVARSIARPKQPPAENEPMPIFTSGGREKRRLKTIE